MQKWSSGSRMKIVRLIHLASLPLPPTAHKQLFEALLIMSRDEDAKEASGSAQQPFPHTSRSGASSSEQSITKGKKKGEEARMTSSSNNLKGSVRRSKGGGEKGDATKDTAAQHSTSNSLRSNKATRTMLKSSSDDQEHDGPRRRLVGRATGVTVSSDASARQVVEGVS